MLAGLTWLLVYQCIGEILVRWTGLPVPGPVIGMVLLFATLVVEAGCAGLAAVRGIGTAVASVAAVRSRRRRRDAALPSRRQ